MEAVRGLGRILFYTAAYSAVIYALVFVCTDVVPWLYSNPKVVLSIGYLISLPLGAIYLVSSVRDVYKMRPVVPDLVAANAYIAIWFIGYTISAPFMIWEDYLIQFLHCTPI